MTATTLSSEVKIAKTPAMPTFKTAGEERLHRKQRLASAFRLFAKFGFSEGRCRTYYGPRSGKGRPLLGKSVWHALRAHPRIRSGSGE